MPPPPPPPNAQNEPTRSGIPLADSRQDKLRADRQPKTPPSTSPSYRLAYADEEFLCREELRPVRLAARTAQVGDDPCRGRHPFHRGDVRRRQDPRARQRRPGPPKNEIQAKNLTAAAPKKYYEGEARAFARLCSTHSLSMDGKEFVVVTGWRAWRDGGGKPRAPTTSERPRSASMWVLPHEQAPNAYVTPELSLNFHYFAIRKMHFLMRARAITIFPGGLRHHG